MLDVTATVLITTLISHGSIGRDDVHALRHVLARAGDPDSAIVEALAMLEASCTSKAQEWLPFFVETTAEHFVFDRLPLGRFGPEKARELEANLAGLGVSAQTIHCVLEAARRRSTPNRQSGLTPLSLHGNTGAIVGV
jgi:hypothetical protein